jgi:hypothetical protein
VERERERERERRERYEKKTVEEGYPPPTSNIILTQPPQLSPHFPFLFSL